MPFPAGWGTLAPMRLPVYLEARRESQRAFAVRAGVSYNTVNQICRGGGTRTSTALRIVEATEGMVRIEDLVPEDAATESA